MSLGRPSGKMYCLGGCKRYVDSDMPLCDECFAELYRLSQRHCPKCEHTLGECTCTGVKAITLFAYKGRRAAKFIFNIKQKVTWEALGFWAKLVLTELELKHIEPFDAVTAVPSRKRAVQLYGYGHAEALGIELAARLDIPFVDMLSRRDNAEQKLLSATQRKQNMKYKYAFLEGSNTDPNTGKPYKRVLLVDDVITTGDTLSYCRSLIKSHGSKDIVCLTLAKTI